MTPDEAKRIDECNYFSIHKADNGWNLSAYSKLEDVDSKGPRYMLESKGQPLLRLAKFFYEAYMALHKPDLDAHNKEPKFE